MGNRGGRRPGAGRKPKNAALRVLDGGIGHKSAAEMEQIAQAIVSEVEEFGPPAGLNSQELAVWKQQAPFAFKARTLTQGTALSFARYCAAVVWAEQCAAGDRVGGADHRGLLRQINAYELQFMLTPCGKAIFEQAEPVKAANPLSRFLNRA